MKLPNVSMTPFEAYMQEVKFEPRSTQVSFEKQYGLLQGLKKKKSSIAPKTDSKFFQIQSQQIQNYASYDNTRREHVSIQTPQSQEKPVSMSPTRNQTYFGVPYYNAVNENMRITKMNNQFKQTKAKCINRYLPRIKNQSKSVCEFNGSMFQSQSSVAFSQYESLSREVSQMDQIIKNKVSIINQQIVEDGLLNKRRSQISSMTTIQTPQEKEPINVKSVIDELDLLIDSKVHQKQFQKQIKEKNVKRFVKKSKLHAENRLKTFVDDKLSTLSENKMDFIQKRAEKLKGYDKETKKQVMDSYLEHQDKLIEIFDVKQRSLEAKEEQNVSVLKKVLMKSDKFSEFASKVIEKDHVFRLKKERLEEEVYPRDIQKVIKQNIGLSSTGPSSPTKLQECDPEYLQKEPKILDHKANGIGGSEFLNGIFDSIDTQNTQLKRSDEIMQQFVSKIQKLYTKKYSHTNYNKYLKIKNIINDDSSNINKNWSLLRRTTMIDFRLLKLLREQLNEKEQFIDIIQQINRFDNLNKTYVRNISRKKLQQMEMEYIEKLHRQISYDFKNIDQIYMGEIYQFKALVQKIFKLGNIGEKYLDLNKNEWSRVPEYGNDFDHLAIILQKQQNSSVSPNEGNEIQNLFDGEIQKYSFFLEAKNSAISSDVKSTEVNRYVRSCINDLSVPSFFQIQNHELFLIEQRMSEKQAIALRDLLEKYKGRQDSDRMVKKLVIDDCSLKDGTLSAILEGIKSQDTVKVIQISNVHFESKSQRVLEEIFDQKKLQEMHFTNLVGANVNIMQKLVGSMHNSENLLKLKLSKINLNSRELVHSLCNLLFTPDDGYDSCGQFQLKRLYLLDLSWTQLTPRYLCQIVQALNNAQQYDIDNQTKFHNIRQIDLSYNSLHFDREFVYLSYEQQKAMNKKSKKSEPLNTQFNVQQRALLQNSAEFVIGFETYLRKSQIMNHMNVSGMNFDPQNLIRIVESSKQIDSLVAIHLSDLGLNENPQLALLILDIFNVEKSRFHFKTEIEVNKRAQNVDIIKKCLIKSDPSINLKKMNSKKKILDIQQYKEYLINAKQKKQINNLKIANQSQIGHGIGRMETSSFDNFILTRKVQNPEMIFNQNEFIDKYFDTNSAYKWLLSNKNECYVCQRYKQVAIIFEENCDNHSFQEIKDKELKDFLKLSLNLNLHDKEVKMPIIFGTVTHGFDKKQKMIDTSLYALLSIVQNKKIVKPEYQVKIKNGVENMLKTTNNGKLYKVSQFFQGWNYILDHKLNNNEIQDIHTLNMPEDLTSKYTKLENIYIYSEYLPAGHHQFLIYHDERFFSHSFFLELSNKDHFTDFPLAQKLKQKRDVWRHWPEETLVSQNSQFVEKMFQDDMKNDGFEHLDQETRSVVQIHYTAILIYYQTMQSLSECFPLVDLSVLKWTDKEGQVDRLQFLMLLAQQNDLDQLIKDQIMDIYLESEIIYDRMAIRSSRRVNALLSDNYVPLTVLFETFADQNAKDNEYGLKTKKYITYQQCHEIFNIRPPATKNVQKRKQAVISKPLYEMSDIRHLFVMSKAFDSLHQNTMVYEEFLELVCRFALKYDTTDQKICGVIFTFLQKLLTQVLPLDRQYFRASRFTNEKNKEFLKKFCESEPVEIVPIDLSIEEEDEILNKYFETQVQIDKKLEEEEKYMKESGNW